VIGGGIELPVAHQVVPAGPLRVQYVQPGSPAQRAGLRPGDLVTRLNGRPPESPEFAVLFQQLRPVQPGLPHSPQAIRLTVVRAGRQEPFEVAITATPYRPESVYGARRRADGSWDFMLDPAENVGYVRLDGIRKGPRATEDNYYGSHQEFRDALRALEDGGVRGLLLDLRWCPGGYLTEASTIARLLLPAHLALPERPPEKSPIAWQRGRTSDKRAVEFEVLDKFRTEFPVVVLINGETSGGGELVAAALQDFGRAAIAGQRTRGKGSVQLEDQVTRFKLTSWVLLRPTEKNLQRFPDSKPSDDWGVRPDPGRELALTPEAGRRLKEWWTVQTLRPPGDPEALPLDDPENDPQRLAAVQMLRMMLKK
jgi:carboxyl-terminal processing protease